MSPQQDLERFLIQVFSTSQLLRWVVHLGDESLPAELPVEGKSLADIAHNVVHELRRRGTPANTIFASLLKERPLHAETIAVLRSRWSRPPQRVPDHRVRTSPAHLVTLTAFALILLIVLVTLASDDPVTPAVLHLDEQPSPLPHPSTVRPFLPDATPAEPPPPVPALRMSLRDCLGSVCTDVVDVNRRQLCNRTTITVRLTASRTYHVTFANLSAGEWRLGNPKLDINLEPLVPIDANIYVFADDLAGGSVHESLVALAFSDVDSRQLFRAHFADRRTGPDLPSADELGLPDMTWEEARIDYEITTDCS